VILDEAQNTASEQMKMFLNEARLLVPDRCPPGHYPDRPAGQTFLGLIEVQTILKGSAASSSSTYRKRRGQAPPGPEDNQGLREKRHGKKEKTVVKEKDKPPSISPTGNFFSFFFFPSPGLTGQRSARPLGSSSMRQATSPEQVSAPPMSSPCPAPTGS